MTIKENRNGTELTLSLTGKIDSTNYTELVQAATGKLDGVELLVLDFCDMEHLSSAGLRSLLMVQKLMAKQGKMVVRGANEAVKEIFSFTGFDKVLNIE